MFILFPAAVGYNTSWLYKLTIEFESQPHSYLYSTQTLYLHTHKQTNFISTNVNAAPTSELLMHHADVTEGMKLKNIMMVLKTQRFVKIV